MIAPIAELRAPFQAQRRQKDIIAPIAQGQSRGRHTIQMKPATEGITDMNTGITSWTEIEGEAKHTALPWKLGREDYAYFEHAKETIKHSAVGIDGGNGDNDLARVSLSDPNGMANARFICQAVNCHDELVAALEQMLYCGSFGNEAVEARVKAMTVLAKSKAKGGV